MSMKKHKFNFSLYNVKAFVLTSGKKYARINTNDRVNRKKHKFERSPYDVIL